jgi:hypothetical protein
VDAAVKVAVVASVAMVAQEQMALTLPTVVPTAGAAVMAAKVVTAVSAAWVAHRVREVARP